MCNQKLTVTVHLRCYSSIAQFTTYSFHIELSRYSIVFDTPFLNWIKKDTCEICWTQSRSNFEWKTDNFSTGTLRFSRESFIQRLLRITSLCYSSFLNWLLMLDCTLRWQQSCGIEQFILAGSWNLFRPSKLFTFLCILCWESDSVFFDRWPNIIPFL